MNEEKMTRTLVTPYFLDTRDAGYEALAGEKAMLNAGPLDQESGDIQHRVLPLYENIATFVAETAGRGELPVALNGDCVMAIPVLAGLQRAGIDPFLIWFDAHGDFNTWETTPSGFLGGMPLAMMVGLGEQTIVDGVGQETLPPEDVILTDGRDLDPGEQELVTGSGINHLVNIRHLLAFPLPDRPLWVHFDADILRLEDLPAVSYPAPGGPSVAELRQVFRHLRETGRLVALSVSLPTPHLDQNNQSQETAVGLVDELLAPNNE